MSRLLFPRELIKQLKICMFGQVTKYTQVLFLMSLLYYQVLIKVISCLIDLQKQLASHYSPVAHCCGRTLCMQVMILRAYSHTFSEKIPKFTIYYYK